MKKSIFMLLMVLITASLAGCSTNKDNDPSEYKIITSVQAKEMMDQDSQIIILDVRSDEEFQTGHIEGAILIPDTEIKKSAESTLTDKSATILVYCRSGRRSALASKDLVELGYDHVYDFGGIADWTYNIVK